MSTVKTEREAMEVTSRKQRHNTNAVNLTGWRQTAHSLDYLLGTSYSFALGRKRISSKWV